MDSEPTADAEVGAREDAGGGVGADEERVWLVERTYGDDELNLVILVYATADGERYLRKERALTSFSDDRRTPASLVVPSSALAAVDPSERERYAAEARRTREQYGPDGAV